MANFLDRIISALNPEAGIRRELSRQKLERMRKYDGATKGRRGDGWNGSASHNQNIDISRSITALRDRSVDGYKNNSNVFKAIRTIQNNTIGTGIMPTPKVYPGEKAITKKELEIIKSRWEWFSEHCDFEEDLEFGGIQTLSMRTTAMLGEVFLVRQRDAKSLVPFKIQVLGPHMVDQTKNTLLTNSRPGNYVVQGVEFDSRGRKVGYWMHEYDPRNEFVLKLAPVFVPKEDVIHLYYKEFTGQVRGVPFGTSAMLNMRDLSDYEDAALMGMKVAACHVAFTTQEKTDDETGPADNSDSPEHLEPGMINYLNPGEEVTFNNPPTPANYADYVTKNQQKNASAYMITYEQLTGDLSKVNFSSGRMGWIDSNKNIEDLQYNMFIPNMCKKVWDWFIYALIAKGDLSRYIGADWTPQGREMLDPVKEMNGLILELKSGLISWTEACKRRGYNPDVLMQQIKDDKKMFEDAGIDVEWIIAKAASGEDPDAQKMEDIKRTFDSYGVAVRAGAMTPTQDDEVFFRNAAGLPEMNEAAVQAWKDDDGVRRPITLTQPEETPPPSEPSE